MPTTPVIAAPPCWYFCRVREGDVRLVRYPVAAWRVEAGRPTVALIAKPGEPGPVVPSMEDMAALVGLCPPDREAQSLFATEDLQDAARRLFAFLHPRKAAKAQRTSVREVELSGVRLARPRLALTPLDPDPAAPAVVIEGRRGPRYASPEEIVVARYLEAAAGRDPERRLTNREIADDLDRHGLAGIVGPAGLAGIDPSARSYLAGEGLSWARWARPSLWKVRAMTNRLAEIGLLDRALERGASGRFGRYRLRWRSDAVAAALPAGNAAYRRYLRSAIASLFERGWAGEGLGAGVVLPADDDDQAAWGRCYQLRSERGWWRNCRRIGRIPEGFSAEQIAHHQRLDAEEEAAAATR